MDRREAVVAAYAGLMAIVVLFTLGASHPEWWTDHGFVYRFQTLIGAAVAVLAALVGGGAVYHQTLSARARDRRGDALKERATRALLPHIMSRIVDYAEGSIATLNSMRTGAKGEHVPKGATFIAAPSLPFELMERLAAASETAGEGAQEALSALLLSLQLQHARLTMYEEGLIKGSASSLLVFVSNLDSVALDTADVYARLSRLYPYARFKAESASASLTNRDAWEALGTLGYDGEWSDFSYNVTDEWLDRPR